MSPTTHSEEPGPRPVDGVPTTRGVLGVLTKPRLSALARAFALSLPAKGSKDELLDAMVAGSALPFASLLRS